MAQPEYVPVDDNDRMRVTELLPTPRPWTADRPGDVKAAGGQVAGPWFGSAGPDQGYALLLAGRMRDQLTLTPGEHVEDVIAGCVEVAMKRAASYGRAPVGADVEVAFTLWGFLGETPDPELVAFRRVMFAQVSHHYGDRRAIVDLVADATFRLTPGEVRARAATAWRELLSHPAPAA
jgi:hypothetical protein